MSADGGEPLRTPVAALARALIFARGRYPDLSLTELMILVVVAENEGVTVSSLALICGHSGATASRTVRGLAEAGTPGVLGPARGLTRLMRGPTEDRSRHAFLTPEGKAFCARLGRLLSSG